MLIAGSVAQHHLDTLTLVDERCVDIDSAGGNLVTAQTIGRLISCRSMNTRGHTFVCSAAVFILIAGTHRTIRKDTAIVIHPVRYPFEALRLPNLVPAQLLLDIARQVQIDQEANVAYLTQFCNLPSDVIARSLIEDIVITPQQALEWNMADEIVDGYAVIG